MEKYHCIGKMLKLVKRRCYLGRLASLCSSDFRLQRLEMAAVEWIDFVPAIAERSAGELFFR
jgi:hypothetical protein